MSEIRSVFCEESKYVDVKIDSLEKRIANLEKALIEYSKTQPKLLEILKDLRIL